MCVHMVYSYLDGVRGLGASVSLSIDLWGCIEMRDVDAWCVIQLCGVRSRRAHVVEVVFDFSEASLRLHVKRSVSRFDIL